MYWQITPPALIFLLTATLVTGATFLIWHHRKAMGGMLIFWLMFAVLIWTITAVLGAASIGFDQKLFWAKLSFFGIASSGPLMLIFSLVFTHKRHWITLRRLTLLWTIPFLTIFLVTTNEFQKLIWSKIAINNDLNLLIFQFGPAFWIDTIYAYLCIAMADFMLIREYRRSTGLYKNQISIIVASSVFPMLGSIIYLFGFDPVPGLDTTIISFSLTSILITIAIT